MSESNKVSPKYAAAVLAGQLEFIDGKEVQLEGLEVTGYITIILGGEGRAKICCMNADVPEMLLAIKALAHAIEARIDIIRVPPKEEQN